MELRHRLAEVWPLFGLSIRTPRLELRYADDQDLLDLAARSHDIHDPAARPFGTQWNRADSELDRERGVLAYSWARRSEVSPAAWSLTLVTVVDGAVVGMQGVGATRFAVTRTVGTGSWLHRSVQGQGIGTEMRQAVLHLAFEGLGAVRAESGAWEDNPHSIAVSTKAGYRQVGDKLLADEATRRRELLFVMDREDWTSRRRDDIELVGVEACLPVLVGAA